MKVPSLSEEQIIIHNFLRLTITEMVLSVLKPNKKAKIKNIQERIEICFGRKVGLRNLSAALSTLQTKQVVINASGKGIHDANWVRPFKKTSTQSLPDKKCDNPFCKKMVRPYQKCCSRTCSGHLKAWKCVVAQ